MVKKLFYFVVILSFFNSCKQEISIIPQPLEVIQTGKGSFEISKNTTLSFDNATKNSADFLLNYCKEIYGISIESISAGNSKEIDNSIVLRYDSTFAPGQYELNIEKNKIQIKGSEDGVFYGIQSLIQLMPLKVESLLRVPVLSIKDKPRFAYRGLLIDVGRYYLPFDFLKRCVDFASLHKMNKLQIHLTDDQGWRLEIGKYPKLTKVGAWRNGTMIGLYPGTGNDGIKHGGFYTKEQMKELVEYGKKHYVTIIPEIEMPGHALGALASYPYLGCTGGPYKVKEEWGAGEDVFCAGNDSTFLFIENVLKEVMEIFPSEYIHIGGDECPKERWKNCPQCQARIKKENLKDENELQSYFIHRVEKFLNANGRKIIGWDEILEGGVSPNATVMSWHGDGVAGCVGAVKAKRPVIMSPSYGFYLDYPQTSREDSLVANWGGVTPVKKTYMYKIIPDTLTADESKFIIGGQTAIWCEYINNPSKAEYMVFPRLSAVSEVLWSSQENRDWQKFKKKMNSMYERYKLWKINYNPANLDAE